MITSGNSFKAGIDKAFSGIQLNNDTMTDAASFKQGFKEGDVDENMIATDINEKDKKKISKKEPKEATGSGSSGAYSGPLFSGEEPNPDELKKMETKEATSSGSVGAYSTPSMWAKSTKKKDWGPSRKTQIPGGGFVKVKKKCTKFPYCNQGDIGALNISKNESVSEAIKNVAKKINLSESVIKSILEYEYKKLNKRNK